MTRRRRLELAGLLVLLAAGSAGAGAPEGRPAADAEAWRQAGREALERTRARVASAGPARNAILFVGDGMGLSTVTAARILEGQLRGGSGEENRLAFERLPYLALAVTYNTDQQTPDSAGTMTAMTTGAKTRAGVVAVDPSVTPGDHAAVEGHRLRTILEEAEERGLATGVVTTTTITHATPAAAYAHSPDRDWESDADLPDAAREAGFPDIARQLVEFAHGDGLEVALGGGRAHFLPEGVPDPERPGATGGRRDGRDLTAEWVRRRPRSAWVWKRAQLEALDRDATDHLLGLFEPSHMNFEADRAGDAAGEPSLMEMTELALDLLARSPRGFVLIVEGGRIDHGHHAGNAYRALTDTIEFSRAVEAALARTSPEETLIVVTADHDHTFSLGGYATRGNPILGPVVENDERGQPESGPARDGLGRPYTALGYLNGPGYTGASDAQPEGPKRFPHFPEETRGVTRGRPDLGEVDTADPGYLQEAAVPLRSETHSPEDVPIYAGGPGAHLFDGVQEQSYVYHAIVEALGWRRAP
jgi:alkaline phosphatase